ncbi:hypothetical protein H4R33_006196 [Dimargaris cristalligena]|nr:hypothetical protein H4R33_006196 [Dimargaris cristalligena]
MDNIELLTRGSRIWEKKRKFKQNQLDEIVFDESNRAEFLTGFSKRKQAKKRKHQETLLEKEKEALRELKRELVTNLNVGLNILPAINSTEQRKSEQNRLLEEKIAEQKAYYGVLDDSESDDDGDNNTKSGKGATVSKSTDSAENENASSDLETGPKPEVSEFKADDSLTTVTVVTDLDMNDLQSWTTGEKSQSTSSLSGILKKNAAETTPAPVKPKLKKIKKRTFKYETKSARLRENTKQYTKHKTRLENMKDKKTTRKR